MENDINKLSKSDFNDPTGIKISKNIKILALKAEMKYWKLRYYLLKKFR
jgi:hypothetical protein